MRLEKHIPNFIAEVRTGSVTQCRAGIAPLFGVPQHSVDKGECIIVKTGAGHKAKIGRGVFLVLKGSSDLIHITQAPLFKPAK